METIKNNEFIYTSADGKKIDEFERVSKFGENLSIVSHTYENGIGRVVFDGDVTKIGDYAFSRCSSLSSIVIPNSVTSIGEVAFLGCFKLFKIVLPTKIARIGCGAFLSCSNLYDSSRCFKVFYSDMSCIGFKYKEGQSYHTDNIRLCKRGFHYCTSILELFNYYSGEDGKDIVIHEVFPSGQIIKQTNSTKHCCSDIKIGRRIKFSEISGIVREMLIDVK